MESKIPNANTKCPVCDGLGCIVRTVDAFGNPLWENCECTKREILAAKLKFAEVPEGLKNHKIKDFRIDLYQTAEGKRDGASAKKEAIEYIKDYPKYKEMGKGLYLYSEMPGSGKTRMAISLGNAIHNQYQDSVRFTTTLDLLDKIKSTFRRSDDREAKENLEMSQTNLLKAFKEIDVLILDDIGTERPTEWVETIFYSILNGRSDNKKVTIFTSNCAVEGLLYHPKIKQRIARLAKPVTFPEESIRETLTKYENEVMQRELLGL